MTEKATERRTVGLTVFDRNEFAARLLACKRKMAEQSLDALLVTDPANMHYLTGYDGWSFYVPQCVVLTIDWDEPVWIGRGIDAPGVPVTTYLKPENVDSYLDNYVHADDIHPADFIVDMLKHRGIDSGTIGVELDSNYYTGAMHKRLSESLDEATLVDCRNLVNWVRAIKSDREIILMRQAAAILDRVMAVAIDMIEPGVRQCDVAAEIRKAQVAGTESFGGDYTAIVPLLPTGVNTSVPHLHWTDKPFAADELVVMELAAARHHYHCPMARTMFLGEPPEVLLKIAAAAQEGVEAALGTIRPGVKLEEIEAAFRAVLARHGYVKASRMGYSVGLGYPPDWGERTMSIRPGAAEILEPNMTFHLMPALWGDNWGVEISQTFRVSEDGHEPLGSIPRRLIVKK
ncbi:MAG: M24 family metallopeptidase [Candidatus Obscuribacterales bacterium]